jgi:hypothetical protein
MCGSHSTSTCGIGSSNDMECACNSGYFGDGSICNPCKICDSQAIQSGNLCSIGSKEDTVICTCNAGYSGDGIKCAASKSSFTLTILVTLSMSIADFTSKEHEFIISVASAASVSSNSVRILNVTAVSTNSTRAIVYSATGRSLLSTSLQVTTIIISDNEITITEENLNFYLNQNGLPRGFLVIIKSTKTYATTVPASQSSGSGSYMSVEAASGIAVGSVVLLTTAIFLVKFGTLDLFDFKFVCSVCAGIIIKHD